MKQSHSSLRFTLLLAAAGFAITAYIALFNPDFLLRFYPAVTVGEPLQHLLLAFGSVMIVLTIGALLAFFQPMKHSGTVLLVTLVHFAFFLVDVIILVRGTDLKARYLLAEMAYLIIICILLVRYYPTAIKMENFNQTADVLVDVVKDKLQTDAKEEAKERKRQEKVEKQMAKDMLKTAKEELKKDEE